MRPFTITLVILLGIILAMAPTAVLANTEKVIFTVGENAAPAAEPRAGGSRDEVGHSRSTESPTKWKRLVPPHTIVRNETILPSLHEKDPVSLAHRKVEAGSLLLTKDAVEGADGESTAFTWYVLAGLQPGASYELRISYPATFPTDFAMNVFTLDAAQEYAPTDVVLSEQFPPDTMLARINATYTGVSYKSSGLFGPETLPVPYNLVLERLYFMIPYQALKLAAVIIVVAAVGLGYVVPRIHGSLLALATAGPRTIEGSKKRL